MARDSLKHFTRKPKRLVAGISACENNDQFLEDRFYIIWAGEDTDSCSTGENDAPIANKTVLVLEFDWLISVLTGRIQSNSNGTFQLCFVLCVFFY